MGRPCAVPRSSPVPLIALLGAPSSAPLDATTGVLECCGAGGPSVALPGVLPSYPLFAPIPHQAPPPSQAPPTPQVPTKPQDRPTPCTPPSENLATPHAGADSKIPHSGAHPITPSDPPLLPTIPRSPPVSRSPSTSPLHCISPAQLLFMNCVLFFIMFHFYIEGINFHGGGTMVGGNGWERGSGIEGASEGKGGDYGTIFDWMTPAQHGNISLATSLLPNMNSIPILILWIVWFSLKFLLLANPIGIVVFGLFVGYSRLSIKTYADLPTKRKMFMKSRKLAMSKKTNILALILIILQVTIYFYKHTDLDRETLQDTKATPDEKNINSMQLSYKIAENKLCQDFKWYAISKLKFKHICSFNRVLSLLSGDIEVNPGPSQPCKACAGQVNKRSLFCGCGIAYHRKCVKKGDISLPFVCMDCASQMDEIDNTGLQTKPETEQLQQNNTQNLDDLTIPDMDYTHKVTQHLPEKDNWEPFRKKGMHFLHLNVNSLLPKIHEIRKIAQDSKATIIGITETKLDKTIFDNEVNIDGYNIIRKDRTRHGGGVCCYIKNDRSFNVRENFGTDFENVFLDILLPNSKPILIGILYRPPNQSGFLDSLSTAILNSEKSDNQEIYLLGDLNFNLLDSNGGIFQTIIMTQTPPHGTNNIRTSAFLITSNN